MATTLESVCPTCGTTHRSDISEIGQIYGCRKCNTQCIVPSREIDPGMRFGDFVVQHPLGAGSSGEVHLAQEVNSGGSVALKILMVENEDEVDVQRFIREARNARSLNHPGVVRIYDAGQSGKYYYLAMEYVSGETLDKMLSNHGAFAERDALRVVRDVAVAMRYAWNEKQLVHRDIKPANIMLSYEGVTKLMDLGIAKSLMYDLTQLTDPDMVIGSPPYMSPEQCAPGKRLDQRADIYSLGATLFQLLTEEYAFEGENPLQTLRMQISSPLRDPRDINTDLTEACGELVKKMMAKSAANRYQDWSELLLDVNAILEA